MIGYFEAQTDITLQPSCTPDPSDKIFLAKGDVIKLDPVKYTRGRQQIYVPVKCLGTDYTKYAYVTTWQLKEVPVCGENGTSNYTDEECKNPLNVIDKIANEKKFLGMPPLLGYGVVTIGGIVLIALAVKAIRNN